MGKELLDKGDTKTAIVDAAISALEKRGLPLLSYDAIAEEAGVTRQAVRYHFADPEALMLAICDRLADAYRNALIVNAARLQGPNRLEVFLDFYFNLLDGTLKPEDDAAYDAMMSLARGSSAVRRNLATQYRTVGDVMCHEFRVSHPELGHRSAEELSYLFVCLMYGHWKMVASLGISASHNRIARAAIDRLIRSYCSVGAREDGEEKVWSGNG